MHDYRKALEVATQAALAAGEVLRREFNLPGGPRGPIGKAIADNEAEAVIRQHVLAAFPWSYLGEETGSYEGADRSHRWLVDPNDGTALYQRGQRGSAVSIALLRGAQPVLGVVYAFCAPDDNGDLFTWAEGCGPLLRNGHSSPPAFSSALGAHDVVLLSPGADAMSNANREALHPARFRGLPSVAYRLALAAAGDGVAAVSIHTPGAWDYGGGHALLIGAGGAFVNETGQPVTYSAVSGESRTVRCFGGASGVVEELARRAWDPLRHGPREPRARYEPVRLQPGRNIADPDLLSRAQGCLLGQLAGDSLGSLVEFQSASQIRAAYPRGVRTLADGGAFGTIAGQPTDDSEMALLLARSLVERGGYDRNAAAGAYAYWRRSAPFDIGNATRRALDPIQQADVDAGRAADMTTAAADPQTQANGCLMRISPLAVFGYDAPPEQLAAWAQSDAALTHPHAVCREATALYVTSVACAVRAGASAREVYSFACEWAGRHVRQDAVRGALNAAATRPPEYGRNPGWVLVALQNAFHQLLHAPSFEEGVVRTVMGGGDTDTNAAIAGALLGAVHGRDAVPHQWRQMVLSCRPIEGVPGVRQPRPRDFWPVDALLLAERLLLHG